MRKKAAAVLILALTAALAAGGSLTDTNFSVIGNRGRGRILFLAWGALVAVWGYISMEDLMEQGQIQDGWTEGFLLLAELCFLWGLGLPYRPRLVPGMAGLHVGLSLTGCLFFLFCTIRFLHQLERRFGRQFGWEKAFLWSVLLISAALYRAVGIISGLLELFVTLTFVWYLKRMEKKLVKISLAKGGECVILNRLK